MPLFKAILDRLTTHSNENEHVDIFVAINVFTEKGKNEKTLLFYWLEGIEFRIMLWLFTCGFQVAKKNNYVVSTEKEIQIKTCQTICFKSLLSVTVSG